MPRIIGKPVRAVVGPDGLPRAFFFKGRQAVAEILDIWVEIGEWWHGGPEVTVYRVLTRSGAMMELERDSGSNSWRIYKIYD